MRRLLSVMGIVAALGAAHVARADDDWDDDAAPQQDAQVSPEVFQQQLQPYGQWEYDGAYGQVFYPEVAAGWRPYTYGHWAWTDAGWLWVSDEPFGWATFHYGRWWYNPYRHHWGWVPGYEWAPAWVTFRFGGASIGWAPLYVGYDAWVDGYPVYYDHWNFVPCEHFYGGPVYAYIYEPTYVRTVFYSTQVSTGYVGTTSYGPPTTYVAAHSAVPITTTPMTHAATPAAAGQTTSSGAVAVYQPPTTQVYNPTRPAPVALRGPGAARTPVVAPPTVRGAFNSPTFANRSPVSQPVMGQAGTMRPGTPSLPQRNGSAFPRPNAPTYGGFNNGAVQRPSAPSLPQRNGSELPRPNAPTYGGFNNGGVQRPGNLSGPVYRPSYPGTNRSQVPAQINPPPNNYRPSMPAPVQQPRPQMSAPPHAMQQQLGGARPSFNPPAMSRPAPSFAAARPSFSLPSAQSRAPSFAPVKRR